MLSGFHEHPGRLYLVIAGLPLLAAAVLAVGGLVRNAVKPARHRGPLASFVYWLLGGAKPLRSGAYFALFCMIGAAVLAGYGVATFLGEAADDAPLGEGRWAESASWARLGDKLMDDRPALELNLGYHIDHLTAVAVMMVTFVASLIFVFSLGYMREETQEEVEDHETHGRRRGRFGQFYMYLSMFCFAMLNLLIADNLLQVFVGWELVGFCSFLLIGFYHERPAAGAAANKAFVVNRVGDAGFLIGLGVIFAHVGTFQFDGMFDRLRSPEGELVRAAPVPLVEGRVRQAEDGALVALRPVRPLGTERAIEDAFFVKPNPGVNEPATMPYWLLTLAGVGVFLGCVGKSAQFPLHVWLPDAMEGPTPVSALIHAATMVAAGVYLVGRCYPLFTPDVLLLIAYCGAITLLLGASMALVADDIKRVLAYSTVSQLGYMMLALGVGGYVAGLLHLITHAFFKALLFLGAGAVIHGLAHTQDLRRMGGLRKKMPIVAGTMLVGVLAIVGTPLFSGWYSKDAILADAYGFASQDWGHFLLFVLPLVTAGLTAFYMLRLWLLAFSGEPRDAALHEKAHRAPWVMALPLIVLAAGSLAVGWGDPVWDAEASYVGGLLKQSSPAAVGASFTDAHAAAHENHLWVGGVALLVTLIGAGVAWAAFGARRLDLTGRAAWWTRLLRERWHIDAVYDRAAVGPAVAAARAGRDFDRSETRGSLDGVFNAVANAVHALGVTLRAAQGGRVRSYVLLLALAAALFLSAVSVFAG